MTLVARAKRASLALSKLSLGALLGLFVFRGDACICGGGNRPPPPRAAARERHGEPDAAPSGLISLERGFPHR